MRRDSKNQKFCKIFRSGPTDPRTKLSRRLLNRCGVHDGDMLYFTESEDDFILSTQKLPEGRLLFEVEVDGEIRARLYPKEFEQLGAVYGDWFQFDFFNDTQAYVQVISKSSSPDEEQSQHTLPEEVKPSKTYPEGATKRITVNAYERNDKARERCLAHYGFNCCVCGFNFEANYGSIGKGYILVHHLVPIASVGKEYNLNPEQDLRPVCPNCHAMLHKKKPDPYTIQELRLKMGILDSNVPSCN